MRAEPRSIGRSLHFANRCVGVPLWRLHGATHILQVFQRRENLHAVHLRLPSGRLLLDDRDGLRERKLHGRCDAGDRTHGMQWRPYRLSDRGSEHAGRRELRSRGRAAGRDCYPYRGTDRMLHQVMSGSGACAQARLSLN